MSSFYDFPVITSESSLPLFLISVGMHECQPPVARKDEYADDQIIYCTKGGGTLIADGVTYKIKPHMGFFMPKRHPHEYFPDGEAWDTHWVVFSGSAAEAMLGFLKFDGVRVFSLPDDEGIKELERLFYRMHESILSDRLYGVHTASGLLYSFLIELNRLINLKKGSNAPLSLILVKTLDYINEHCREKITLGRLSENAGVTKQYLCRLFRDEMDLRPMEYVAKRKMQEAKELLRDPERSIEGIAEELGFCSSSYFQKMFKKYEGITVGKYRKI